MGESAAGPAASVVVMVLPLVGYTDQAVATGTLLHGVLHQAKVILHQ